MRPLLFFFVLFSFLSLHAQSNKSIRNREIRAVTEKILDINKPKNNLWEKNVYDKKGNVIEFIEYDQEGNITNWKRFSFDSKGEEVIQEQKLSPEGKVQKSTAFHYNLRGQKEEEVVTKEDGSIISVTKMEYNGNGDRIKETKKNDKGDVMEIVLFEYDNKGMLTAKKGFNSKNELIFSRTLSYEYK